MNAHHQRRPRIESLEQRAVPSALHVMHFGLPHQSQAHVHRINATGEGEITSIDMASGQVTTTGRINNGLLRGTTAFSAQIVNAQADFVGSTTIVTKHGSIRLSDTGVFNSDGTFVDHATVTGGTRRFGGATGKLVFLGHELSDGVHYLETSITGVVLTEVHPG
jgi:hypothetical protein